MSRLKPDAGPPPVLLEGDERVRALEIAHAEPKTPEDYVEVIGQLWAKAQSAFLDIRRLLIKAKEVLPHGEYTAAVEARLPFSSRTAYQIREATRWVLEIERRKTVEIDSLPGSYTTIYLRSTLEPSLFEQARQEGIIRPDLRCAEIVTWKKDKAGDEAPEERRKKLLREKRRLVDELRRIEAELSGEG